MRCVGSARGLRLKEHCNPLINSYLRNLGNVYENLPCSDIEEIARKIHAISEKNMVFVAGNGGSATTASHMATDLGVGSLRRSNPIRCISLVENAGVLTATGNDLDFSSIFSQQIKLLGKSGDLLICFSASGNSKNLLDAVAAAKIIGVTTVGITGFDGGQLKEVCDLGIHIPTEIGSYGVVEDSHSTVSHLLTELIRAS